MSSMSLNGFDGCLPRPTGNPSHLMHCRCMPQILARRTKNNPILLGEPGVGKTAIGEGLAYAVVHRVHLDGSPLPEFLHDKRILQLDMPLMIAGAKERGERTRRGAKVNGGRERRM